MVAEMPLAKSVADVQAPMAESVPTIKRHVYLKSGTLSLRGVCVQRCSSTTTPPSPCS
jgi:hypothetical protein